MKFTDEDDAWQQWAEADDDEPLTIVFPGFQDGAGRKVRLKTIFQRFWGWPNAAAKHAETFFRETYSGRDKEIRIDDRGAELQETMILDAIPGALPSLLKGLRHRSKRESRDASLDLQSVLIVFDQEITDDGAVSGLLRSLANRLGCSEAEIRSRSYFSWEANSLRIQIPTSILDAVPDPPRT